jgi:hypothetical protein
MDYHYVGGSSPIRLTKKLGFPKVTQVHALRHIYRARAPRPVPPT